MHRSQLAGFIIDCQTEDLEGAARFWSQALGYEIEPLSPEEPGYVGLDTGADDLTVEVQKVAHQSRVHLDIESDDIEAEVARLEALGASRVQQIRSWWVMEAPTGQRFCVVTPQRKCFAESARTWE